MLKKLNACFWTFAIVFTMTSAMLAPKKAYASNFQYISHGCDFSLRFPEPPTVLTIWGDQKMTFPILKFPFSSERIGETAMYNRADYITEDSIYIEATCISIPKEMFLKIDEKMLNAILKSSIIKHRPQSVKSSYSETPNGLKWATVNAGSTRKKKNYFHTHHAMTYHNSVMLINSWYAVTNPVYKMEFNEVHESITLN